jgi:hypothetical protein
MSNWITDREPTIEDGDQFGHVLTTSSEGGVIIERFNRIRKGMPWLPTPTPPVKKSLRWSIGTQHNFLTDGVYTVVISGGETKRDREKIIEVVLDSLNRELS